MKIIMILMLVMGLAACEQKAEQTDETQIHEIQNNEIQNNEIQAVEKTPAPEQQAAKPVAEIEATQPASTMAKETVQEVVTSEPIKTVVQKKAETKPVAAPKAKAAVPQVKTTVQPVAKEKESTTAKPTSKVIAPLVQGKQPIKQQPNPSPSKIILKPDSGMSLAKANNLTKKCKSCHATSKDKVGPSFKKIQAAYGSADALSALFESGFAVESRKVAAADAKWKKKVKTMTGQYKNLIQKQVKKGKFTYKELAEAIFAK